MKPEFIDNREARTLAQALRDLCDDPSCAHAPLDIATAYFNLGAFQQLADVLESRPGVRLLLGTEPLSPSTAPDRTTAVAAPSERGSAKGSRASSASSRPTATRFPSPSAPPATSAGSPPSSVARRSRSAASRTSSSTARPICSAARA